VVETVVGSILKQTFGAVHVTLKNAYKRGKTIIYQRAVPTALRDRYPGPTIKHDLKTSDIALASRKVDELNRCYEAEWAGLLAAPESSPKALRVHAEALLRKFGASPGDTDSLAAEMFFETVEEKLQRHARGDRETYENARPSEYLTPVENEALKAIQGKHQPALSDALTLHLALHKKAADEKFTEYQRRAFNTLLKVGGDKAISAFSRDDARAYITASLKAGAATGTVRRRLAVMSAVFTTWRLEKDKNLANPFERLHITGEGKDQKARIPFNESTLATLYTKCRARDDDMRWLLAMLADTGARLSEVTGLALEDIETAGKVPHIRIAEHPWRSLKNKESARMVPLVGASLWAAQRIIATAEPGQRFAFPRYTNASECRATSASAALNGWMKRNGIDHVNHELRHTMADRLRNVGCPKEIRYAIDGHAAQDVGDTYGAGHGLPILKEWLDKVALKP
jgi:integrase